MNFSLTLWETGGSARSGLGDAAHRLLMADRGLDLRRHRLAHASTGTQMTWVVTADYHVWPEDDLLDHEMSPTCPCGPPHERVETSDSPRWVWTHHALDGREAVEVEAR